MSFRARVKRVAVAAAAGAMVLSMLPAGVVSADEHEADVCDNAPSAPLTNKTDAHGANIDCMYAYTVPDDDRDLPFAGQRIFTGKAGGDADGFGNLTRGQASTLLTKFALVATDGGVLDLLDGDAPEFTDVSEDGAHSPAIAVMADLGLIQGYGDGTFGPFDDITRVQFAQILFEAHEALGVDFDDVTPVEFPDTDREAVEFLAGAGVITGKGDGNFDPFNTVNRGQTATMLVESARVLVAQGIWAADPLPEIVDPAVPAGRTDAPELVDIELQRDDLGGVVRYAFVFDTEVSTQGLDPANFFLHAWDGSSVSAIDVVRDDRGEADGFSNLEANKVRATFPTQFLAARADDSYTDEYPFLAADSVQRDYYTHIGQWPSPEANADLGLGITTAQLRATIDDVTTASVRYGAVRDLDDERLVNPEGSVPVADVALEGAITQWPSLLEVNNFDTVDNTADFVFDNLEGIGVASEVAGSFWLQLDGGTTRSEQRLGQYEVQSTAVTPVGGDTLRVTFDDEVHPDRLTTSLINSVRRAYVDEGVFLRVGENFTPEDGMGNEAYVSPATSTNVAADGRTSRADLLDVEIEGDTVTYIFDQAVEDLVDGPDSVFTAAEAFNIVYYNGQTVRGLSAVRDDASVPNEVTVTFPAGSVTDAVVAAGTTVYRTSGIVDEELITSGTSTPTIVQDERTLWDGAERFRAYISDSAASDTGNRTWVEPQQVGVDQAFAGGETLAPNLVSFDVEVAEINPTTGEVIALDVIYTFDRPVGLFFFTPEEDDLDPELGNATFTLYDEDGARRTAQWTTGAQDVTVGANTVTFEARAGAQFSLIGADDSVIGGVVFGNELLRTPSTVAAGAPDISDDNNGLLVNAVPNLLLPPVTVLPAPVVESSPNLPAYSEAPIVSYETSQPRS